MSASVLALARRDFELAQSYRLSLVFDVGWGLLNLLVYLFISRLVDVGADELGSAPSYFSFAVSGIVMSLVIYATSTGVAFSLRDEQLTGTLEMLCAQPLRTTELAFGVISFPLCFSVGRAAGYLAVAELVLELEARGADWLGVLVMLLAAGLAFAPIGILTAAATIAFKRAMSLASAIIFGMTFVSGALFPVSVLPDPLQAIGHTMPTWFAFEGLRDALFTGDGWYSDAAALLLFGALALPISIWAFAAALRHAKRQGSLGQY